MIVSKDEIRNASGRIKNYIRQTPVLDPGAGSFGLDYSLQIKLECLQHSGSFKTRGAFNNLLMRRVSSAGIVAASGGNHGAACAYAAGILGIPANIFVPEISAPIKIDRIRRYGAKVHVGGARYADALKASERFVKNNDAMSIHAYDHPVTLAGQGTLGLEWQTQSPDLDTMIISVGGGGLIGGVAAWVQDDIKIVAVEPKTSCALNAALESDRVVDVEVSGVAADSLGASSIGDLVFPIARKYVDASLLVSDDAISAAQWALWNDLQIIAEPGGAAALAVLMSGIYKPASGERVGVLVCGGNADLGKLAK